MPDEFGGLEVDQATDEFGGVAIAEERPKRTREQVLASIPNVPGEQMSVLEHIANAAYWPTRVVSRMDPLTAITDALSASAPYNAFEVPAISPEQVAPAVRTFSPFRGDVGSAGQGV